MEQVFSFLELSSLKKCRLLSSQWSYEAGRLFKNFKIRLQPSNSEEEILAKFSFLRRHHLSHTLTLSPLPMPWIYLTETGPPNFKAIMHQYYNQNMDLKFCASLLFAYTNFPDVGEMVNELRVEIMLRNEEDGKLFGKLLTHMPKITRLSLNLVNYTEQGIQFLGGIPSVIKTLGLRVHNCYGVCIHLIQIMLSSHILY